jgi:NitT/TauT family transport system substrate-binding protein
MLTKHHRRSWTALGLIVAMVVVLGPTALRAQNAKKKQSLKVALLPILDSLPYYVADASGFFADVGVKVKVIPVTSGVERDQLMQAGEIDGMLNEMTSTATFNREKVQVRIISSARTAYSDYPLFRVLAAPKSGITKPADLSGVPIGISVNTIIEYVTDRLLAESGLRPAQIVKKSVPVIPERYQLLLQGQLKAATLPDPLDDRAATRRSIAERRHPFRSDTR